MLRETPYTVDEWCEAYENTRAEHLRYTRKMESLLVDILQAKKIGLHLIEARTKELVSFREKILRTSKAYKNLFRKLLTLQAYAL